MMAETMLFRIRRRLLPGHSVRGRPKRTRWQHAPEARRRPTDTPL